jgi:pyruvate,water dikinase
MLSTGALRFLAERWMESHKAKSFVQLSLAGIDRLESKKPLDELSKIEQLIRRNTDAVQVFHTSDAHEIISKLRDNKNTKDVVRALEEYIAKWGFRFGGELLLNRKSWIEDSTELMNQMKKRLQGKNEYDPQSESQNKATCLSGIKLLPSKVNLGRTILLRCLARLSRSAVRLRERSRLKQAQLYCGLRFTALAAGKRLKHHKLIGQIDDVFYLEFDELRAMMLGSYHLPSTVHELISCRKKFLGADRFANKQERIIQTLEQWWLSTTLSFPSSFGSSTPETYDILYGTGASRGIAEAEASVIESLDDIERVKRDSILVTRFTDPGWSSVFPIVRGLVLERGGLLCHGAIIAREYGIPTITDVEDATQKIKDGQLLKIDGNSGTVKFV